MCSKDHKNQPDNYFTLNFKPNDGAFLCFRCGSYGSWYDFTRFMLGDDVNFEKNQSGESSYTDHYQASYPKLGRETFDDRRSSQISALGDPEIIQKTKFIIEECEKAYQNLLDIEDVLRTGTSVDDASIDPHDQRFLILAEAAYYLIGKDSHDQRHLDIETLKKFRVGLGEEAFKDENGELRRVPVVYFPFFRKTVYGKKSIEEQSLLSDGNYEAVKLKLRGASKETKKFQRFKPTGGHFGVFGLNTLLDDSKVVVITEGEFDAMAVHQATKLPAISLPNGASNLPVQLIKMLEGLDRIYLWMDNDEIGQMNVENFAKKLGEKRTYIIRLDSEETAKDANDLLRQGQSGVKKIRSYLMAAKSLPSKDIVD